MKVRGQGIFGTSPGNLVFGPKVGEVPFWDPPKLLKHWEMYGAQ